MSKLATEYRNPFLQKVHRIYGDPYTARIGWCKFEAFTAQKIYENQRIIMLCLQSLSRN